MTVTYANGMTIIHKGDGEQFIAMAPDVCKTPSPGGPIPVPYPNLAFSTDLAQGSKTVKVERNSAALANSNLRMSSGDEGGTAGGGVASNKTKGKLTWIIYSMDVKFEGKGVVRFLDSNMHNGNGGNTGGKNKGKMSYPGGSGDIICDNCGKPIGDPSHKQLSSSRESADQAEQARARSKPARERPMKSAVVVNCKDGRKSAATGVAGDEAHPMNQASFPKIAKNFKSGKALSPRARSDTNKAGNCAEQKALYGSHLLGNFPPPGGCTATMSVVQEQAEKRKHKAVYKHVTSCPTCRRVLTSVMCENAPI